MPVISGGVVTQPGQILCEEVTFTETTGASTYTGSVTVPANSWITNIRIWNAVYWTATTSATLKVGDAVDDDGWFTGIDLKATDIVPNEVIDFENTGGKEGAYIVVATGQRTTMYSTLERVISGIVTTVGAAGNAGRTRMLVEYTTTANAGAATKA